MSKMRITVEIESPFVMGKMVDKAELRWFDIVKLAAMATTKVFVTKVEALDPTTKSFLGRSFNAYWDKGQFVEEWVNNRGQYMRTYYMKEQAQTLAKALMKGLD